MFQEIYDITRNAVLNKHQDTLADNKYIRCLATLAVSTGFDMADVREWNFVHLKDVNKRFMLVNVDNDIIQESTYVRDLVLCGGNFIEIYLYNLDIDTDAEDSDILKYNFITSMIYSLMHSVSKQVITTIENDLVRDSVFAQTLNYASIVLPYAIAKSISSDLKYVAAKNIYDGLNKNPHIDMDDTTFDKLDEAIDELESVKNMFDDGMFFALDREEYKEVFFIDHVAMVAEQMNRDNIDDDTLNNYIADCINKVIPIDEVPEEYRSEVVEAIDNIISNYAYEKLQGRIEDDDIPTELREDVQDLIDSILEDAKSGLTETVVEDIGDDDTSSEVQ